MKSAQIVVLRYGFVKGNGSTRTMVNGSATIAEVIPVVQRYSSKFQHPTKSRRSKTGDGLFDHTWRKKTRATAHCWSDIPVAIAAVLPDCASGLLRQTSFLTTIGRGYHQPMVLIRHLRCDEKQQLSEAAALGRLQRRELRKNVAGLTALVFNNGSPSC